MENERNEAKRNDKTDHKTKKTRLDKLKESDISNYFLECFGKVYIWSAFQIGQIFYEFQVKIFAAERFVFLW